MYHPPSSIHPSQWRMRHSVAWFFLSLIGTVLGFLAFILVLFLSTPVFGPTLDGAEQWLISIPLGIAFGFVLGCIQWLHPFRREIIPKLWIGATSCGAAVGLFVDAQLKLAGYIQRDHHGIVQNGMSITLFIVSIGLFQLFVLLPQGHSRQHLLLIPLNLIPVLFIIAGVTHVFGSWGL